MRGKIRLLTVMLLLPAVSSMAQPLLQVHKCGNTLTDKPCNTMNETNGSAGVYRCGNSYSNTPCLGGKEIDTTPTRGYNPENTSTPHLAWEDFSKNVHAISKGMKESVGIKDNETWEESKRRAKLSYDVKMQCMRLKEDFKKSMTEQQLYKLRLEYVKNGC